MERTITMKSPYNRLVSIVIHECKDLEDEDLAGKSDPYVTIQFPDADDVLSAMDGGETAKTSVVQDNLDPKFFEEFAFLIGPQATKVRLSAFDEDVGVDSDLGSTVVLLGEDCWQKEAALGSKGSIVYSITTIDLSEVRMLSTYDQQAARAEEWERYAGEQTAQIETLSAELAAARGSHEELQSMMENGADASEVLQGELSSLRAQLVEAQQAQMEAQAAAAEQAEAAEALTSQVGSLEARVASLTAQLEGEDADDEEAAAHAAEIEAAKAAAEEQLAAALAAAAADAARANAAEAALEEQAATIAELEAAEGGAEVDDAAFAALREEAQHLRDQVSALGGGSTEDGPYDMSPRAVEVPTEDASTLCVCSGFLFLVSAGESQVWRRHLNGCEWEALGETPAPFTSFTSNGNVAWACSEEGQVFFAANAYGPSLEWQEVEMPEDAGAVIGLSMQNYDDKPMRVYAVTDAEENNAWMNSANGASGWAQLTTPGRLLSMSANGKHTLFVVEGGEVFQAPYSGSVENQAVGEPLGIDACVQAVSDRTRVWSRTESGSIHEREVGSNGNDQLGVPDCQAMSAFDGFCYQLSGNEVWAAGYLGRAERIAAGHPADGPHGSAKSRTPKLHLSRADAAVVASIPAGYLRLFLNMAARTVSTGMLLRVQSAAFGGSLRAEDAEGQVVTARGGGGGLTQIQVRPHPRNPLAVIMQNRGNGRPQEAFQEKADQSGLVVGGSATPPSQFTPVWQTCGGRSNALALRTHSGRHVQVSSSHAVSLGDQTSDATAFAIHVHKKNEL